MARGHLDTLSFAQNRRLTDSARRSGERLWANNRRVWVIAAVLTAIGCHEDLVAIQLGSSAGGSNGSDGSCAGDPCSYTNLTPNPCCSGYWCNEGHCTTLDAGGCTPLGQSCSLNSACCPGYTCQIVSQSRSVCAPSLCYSHGNPCTYDSECCSKHCGSIGSSQRVCLALDGCQPLGEPCTNSNDCCSATCSDVQGSVPICGGGGSTDCKQEGDICVSPGQCSCQQSSMDCNQTLSGLSRCTAPNPGQNCRNAGQSCTQSSQCCSTQCRQDNPGGHFTCHDRCADTGEFCRANSDCCAGYCSPSGVCADIANNCAPLGSPCQPGVDCCDLTLTCDVISDRCWAAP